MTNETELKYIIEVRDRSDGKCMRICFKENIVTYTYFTNEGILLLKKKMTIFFLSLPRSRFEYVFRGCKWNRTCALVLSPTKVRTTKAVDWDKHYHYCYVACVVHVLVQLAEQTKYYNSETSQYTSLSRWSDWVVVLQTLYSCWQFRVGFINAGQMARE